MASQKTKIIEALFRDESRWKNGQLIRGKVTLKEVHDAILANNHISGEKPLSTNNPANFFKDFIRRLSAAEANWPESVLKAGYTAIQRTGAGECFEFIPLPPGQTTAFAVTASVYPKNPLTAKLAIIQTLSLERMTKTLARKDENWLQSVAVSLFIPQTHLALHSSQRLPFVEVGHVQSNLKLRKTEIDGLYYAYLEGGLAALITMEAKGDSDDILESQIEDQVEAIRSLPAVKSMLGLMKAEEDDTIILPMAMKIVDAGCAEDIPGCDDFEIVGKRLMYMAHYAPVKFKGERPDSLTIVGETLFDMRPPIAGVSQ